jgi:2-oxoglutarate dehydrogenase complex dehydrogenase (E1) component-like enzyme
VSLVNNTAIVRIEQLYPYPEQRIAEVLGSISKHSRLVWAQEEPKNQGAWLFIPRLYEDVLKSVNKFVLAMQVVKLLRTCLWFTIFACKTTSSARQ